MKVAKTAQQNGPCGCDYDATKFFVPEGDHFGWLWPEFAI